MSTFLEIGPGRGDFLFYLARENPLTQIIGVEYKFKRHEKLLARLEKNGLTNVTLECGDAKILLPEKFQDASIDHIYILFSDPWPKRKHAKHRLFQKDFVEQILRILKPGGQIFIAHDDPRYVVQIKQVFKEFIASFAFSTDGVHFTTFYADKWVKIGRTIESFSYRKIDCQSDRDYLGMPCVNPTVENN